MFCLQICAQYPGSQQLGLDGEHSAGILRDEASAGQPAAQHILLPELLAAAVLPSGAAAMLEWEAACTTGAGRDRGSGTLASVLPAGQCNAQDELGPDMQDCLRIHSDTGKCAACRPQ